MADQNPFDDPSLQESTRRVDAPPDQLPAWAVEPPPAPEPPFAGGGGNPYGGGGAASSPPPSWAPEADEAPAWAAPPPAAAPPAPPAPNSLEARLPQTKDGLITSMRLLNMAVSVLMAAAACLKLISLPSFTKGIMALYIWRRGGVRDIPNDGRGAAAAASWIFRGTVAAPPRPPAGYSEE